MTFKIGDLVIYRAMGHFRTGYIARVGKTVAVNTHRYDESPLHTRVKLEDCRPFDLWVWDEINLAQAKSRAREREHWALLAQAHAAFDSLPSTEDQV